MKVKKLEFSLNKRGLKGCTWSRLNAQGTEAPLSYLILGLGEFHFCNIGPLASQYENEIVGIFSEQKGFKGMHMVQIECPRH